MPLRNYSTDKSLTAKPSRRIVLPIPRDIYRVLIENCDTYREYIDAIFVSCPELFPMDMAQGYTWHDRYHSQKMPEVSVRRIKLKAQDDHGKEQVFTIVPSFVMPYMSGDTDHIEKALFLRRFGVPFWGLTYIFGHDDMYWYRQVERLGRYNLVGTTVKSPDDLPEHLLADEKHTRFNGEKAYIATTVANDCVLGASLTLNADTSSLAEAYGHFKQEAQMLDPDYQAQTVNTDGWNATQNAWQILFPTIVILQCFLHAFISIRSRCKKLADFPQLCQHIWDVYHAPTVDGFYQQVAELYAWAQTQFTGYAWDTIQKLCFLPYCPRSKIRQHYQSPAHKLNGFVYHDNWLHNLLISTSGQPIYAHHKKW